VDAFPVGPKRRRREQQQIGRFAGSEGLRVRHGVLNRAVDAVRERRANAGAQSRCVDVAGVADEIVAERGRRSGQIHAEKRDELIGDLLPERAKRHGRRRDVALDFHLHVAGALGLQR